MGVRDEPAGAFRYSVATPGQSVLLRGLRVPDAQLGRRKLPGTRSWASRILTSLPRDLDNPWIITERKPGSHLTDLEHSWRRIRERAGLGDVCQRRSKISPPGRSKTSPLNVMRYAVLGGCPGSP